MITASCQACGAIHQVDDALAGRTGRCRCGAAVRIPAGMRPAQPGAAASAEEPLLPLPPLLVAWGRNPTNRILVLAAATAVSLAATAWLLHDPTMDGNPYLDPARRPLAPLVVPASPRPPVWRLELPDGGHGHLVATWRICAPPATPLFQVHWAVADADLIACDILDGSGAPQQPVCVLFRGRGQRHLRNALQAAGIDWLKVRELSPQAVRLTLLERLAEKHALSLRNGLGMQLGRWAQERGKQVVGLDEAGHRAAAYAAQANAAAQALLALAESAQAAPDALLMLQQAWTAGDLEWIAACPWRELLDPLPQPARAAQRQLLTEAIIAACGRSRRPLFAIDAADLGGAGNVRELLTARGFRCTPLVDDPFLEFSGSVPDLLACSDPQLIRPEWIAGWIRREPKQVRTPRISELLQRWLRQPGYEKPILTALAEVLPPISANDAEVIGILKSWNLPGASTVLPALPPGERQTAARAMIAGSAAQDWAVVARELQGSPTELARCALEAGSDAGYRALHQRLAVAGSFDDACRRFLTDRVADPSSATGIRRRELLLLAGTPEAEIDEAWLRSSARKQPWNGHASPDARLWTQIGHERWRSWWRKGTVDRAILAEAARLAARQRDPTTPLGRIAMAAVEEGGQARDAVLGELRLVSYDWLFLLRYWAAIPTAEELTRCETLLAGIDAQWPLRIARSFTARGMVSDEHTKPMGRLVAHRPACLVEILGERACNVTADGRTIPTLEVMMCYEFGALAVGPALALVEDAQSKKVARENAFILLLVIKQQPPPDCVSELPRITAALQRLQAP